MVTATLEKYPSLGIIASIGGFAASILSFLQTASIIIGFIGACIGCAAGVYTFMIKRTHWKRLRAEKQNQTK